jgi:predicted Zn-dependent protease
MAGTPFAALDRAAVARTLSQLAQRSGDFVDAYFERLEEVELPPDGEAPGLRVRREEGFAIRLVREGRTWLASRDDLEPRSFAEALRQVARVLPAAAYPEPRLQIPPWPEVSTEPALLDFPTRLRRAIRQRHVAFPLRLTLRRHRRDLQVVGPGPVPDPERESFYSLTAEFGWTRWGTLLTDLGAATVERVADALVSLFRARHAGSPTPFEGTVVLEPAAAAVLLHEAVAHALEADVLARGGDPDAAVGMTLGPATLSVLDDPAAAPDGVRRHTDDEGIPVTRRWLLRDGVVAQPLADSLWAGGSETLAPGAARRADRHAVPGPRSTHLELPAGDTPEGELTTDAEGGLHAAEARWGRLDPLTGVFELELPCARRIRGGTPADPVGPCRIESTVADLLARITAVGSESRAGGAGWCAKGGAKLPVWATAPALRIEGMRVGRVHDRNVPLELPGDDDRVAGANPSQGDP